jgi:hypothetical protein
MQETSQASDPCASRRVNETPSAVRELDDPPSMWSLVYAHLSEPDLDELLGRVEHDSVDHANARRARRVRHLRSLVVLVVLTALLCAATLAIVVRWR